jgi:hypothetical protein
VSGWFITLLGNRSTKFGLHQIAPNISGITMGKVQCTA